MALIESAGRAENNHSGTSNNRTWGNRGTGKDIFSNINKLTRLIFIIFSIDSLMKSFYQKIYFFILKIIIEKENKDVCATICFEVWIPRKKIDGSNDNNWIYSLLCAG